MIPFLWLRWWFELLFSFLSLCIDFLIVYPSLPSFRVSRTSKYAILPTTSTFLVKWMFGWTINVIEKIVEGSPYPKRIVYISKPYLGLQFDCIKDFSFIHYINTFATARLNGLHILGPKCVVYCSPVCYSVWKFLHFYVENYYPLVP